MRFVIQRVTSGQVTVDKCVTGKIGKGFVVLVGISGGDTEAIADKMVAKLINLRIFDDSEGKTNLSLKDVSGELLIVSQFTLYADCRRGNRPGFSYAGDPEKANRLYEYILEKCSELCEVVQHGKFGADMHVSIENDGPFTIILDSDEMWGG